MNRSSQPNAALQLVPVVEPRQRTPERARSKHLPLAVGRIAEEAREACGCTQAELAALLGVSQQRMAALEQDGRALSFERLAQYPDAYVDAAIGRFALVRAALGHDARQWVAAPEVVHDCEHARDSAIVLELTDVIRARAQRADRKTQRKELLEAIGVLQEAYAALEEQ